MGSHKTLPYRQPGSWHSPRLPSLANVGVFMSWTRAQSGPRLLTVTDRTPATIGMFTGQTIASIVFDNFARPRKVEDSELLWTFTHSHRLKARTQLYHSKQLRRIPS